jgi:hypothetical protein
MGWFRPRSHEYLDDREIPRREAYSAALFVFASALIVVKAAGWQFDRVFFIAEAGSGKREAESWKRPPSLVALTQTCPEQHVVGELPS